MSIDAIDSALSVLRTAWMEAAPEDKDKWMERINEKLDDRNAIAKGHNEEDKTKSN